MNAAVRFLIIKDLHNTLPIEGAPGAHFPHLCSGRLGLPGAAHAYH